MSDSKVVIVVPVYKESINEYEKVSLTQLFRVLSRYDIFFAGPEKCKKILGEFGNAGYEVFDDECWIDTNAYSQLLMSKDFYLRFDRYEYMLIYHLDAFVFSDRLMEFCEKGYDYIGAPLKGKGWKKYHIGNGGLSLRKIASTIRMVEAKNRIMQDPEARDVLLDNEDTFFGFCGYSSKLDYKVPSIYEAGEFSAELDVGHAIRNISKRGLPFGCHAWYQLNYQIWKPAIEKCGYPLPELDKEKNRDEMEYERNQRLKLFVYHVLRHSDETKLKKYRNELKVDGKKAYIRGAGKYGKKTLKLLRALGMEVLGFIDKNADSGFFEGVKIYNPSDFDGLTDAFTVIGSIKYENDFRLELVNKGKREDIEFTTFSGLSASLISIIRDEYAGIPGITCMFEGE